ncbi:Glucanase B [Coniochaeta hoffmannii]|uniref:Glucanase B n=1 Tax=Coniochaeta hoffmannii TaxID=91930 RepID=A0AA38VNL6_9PEZI|nr:Glucanase B [Coniochaeta hoffmannii]
MSTLDEVLAIQKQYHILQAPTATTTAEFKVAATAKTLNITLKNNTNSSNCWAYVTGLDINKNNAVFILKADGVTPYYPTSPSTIQQPLGADCNIKLGAPGSSKVITIPQLAGGRVWLCKDSQLTFKLNPGPAVVEPSVTNTSDANYNLWWSFAEFTYNDFQLFANITYVDFVGMPISLSLVNQSGAVQSVPGIPANGLDTICSALQAQDAKDGGGWSKLIVKHPSGANLRALSPNSGIVMNSSLFNGYYQPYVNAVWAKYASESLTVDTQGQWGTLTGKVVNGQLTFGSVGGFPQPSAKDIFSCSTGAFANYPSGVVDEMGNIGARLAAAFNRSTLLINTKQPTNENVSQFYQNAITNHYSRIVHSVCPDGKGYAFPYDDVDSSSATNVAGTVADSNPKTFTISFGGPTAAVKRESSSVGDHARSGGQARQQVARSGGRIGRRGLEWLAMSAEEEKAALASRDEEEPRAPQMVELAHDSEVDLEEGLQRKLGAELRHGLVLETPQQRGGVRLENLVPAVVQSRLAAVLEKIEESPAYRYAKPAVDVALKALVGLLQLSVKSLVSRVVMVLLLLLCSFLLGVFGRPEVMGAVGLGVAGPAAGLGDA